MTDGSSEVVPVTCLVTCDSSRGPTPKWRGPSHYLLKLHPLFGVQLDTTTALSGTLTGSWHARCAHVSRNVACAPHAHVTTSARARYLKAASAEGGGSLRSLS